MTGDSSHPGGQDPIDAEFEPTRVSPRRAPQRPRPTSGHGTSGFGSALGVFAVAALAGGLAGTLAPRAPGVPALADQLLPNELTALREQQAMARAEIDELLRHGGMTADSRAQLDAARASLTAIESRLAIWDQGLTLLPGGPSEFEPLRRRIAALEALPADPSAASPEQLARAVAGVQERVRTLEEATAAALAFRAAAAEADPIALARRVDQVSVELARLETRLGEAATAAELRGLADQLRQAQERLATVAREATLASERAQASTVLAAAADAARAPGPFEGAYAALAAALPEDPNVRALAALARSGAPSIAQLREEFALIELEVIRAARRVDGGDGVWGGVQGALAPYLVVRRIDAARDLEGDIVERASARLAVGDVQSAAAELSKLTGDARRAVQPWLDRANARIEIDARMAAIRAELSRRGAG